MTDRGKLPVNGVGLPRLLLIGLVAVAVSTPGLLQTAQLARAGVAYHRYALGGGRTGDEAQARVAVDLLRVALQGDGTNGRAWFRLGEMALALGEAELAGEALARAVQLRPGDRRGHLLLGDAYDLLAMPEAAIEQWELGDPSGALRHEARVVSHLAIADARLEAGDQVLGLTVLRGEVLRLDPGNLFALAAVTATAGPELERQHPLWQPYLQQLPQMRPAGDRRYDAYQVRAIASLYRQGHWSREQVLRAGRYYAWHGPEAALQLYAALGGDDGLHDLRAVAVTSLVRLERHSEAISLASGGNSQADARALGMALLAQARRTNAAEDWEAAVTGLAAYHRRFPQDLWPLPQLIEANSALARHAEAERWRASYAEVTEGADVRAAAEALGLAPELLSLGPNLVAGSGFERWEAGRPEHWVWSDMSSRDPWNRGSFVGGVEEIEGLDRLSARVECLWTESDPRRERSRAGYWQRDEKTRALREIALSAGSVHLVSFSYRTEGVEGPGVGFWLSYGAAPCWAGEKLLEPTNGEWRRMAFVCEEAGADDQPLRPLLRLWRPGMVLFDDVRVSEVIVSPAGK